LNGTDASDNDSVVETLVDESPLPDTYEGYLRGGYDGTVQRVAIVCLLGLSTPAAADPPITNSNYGIDLYDGVAIGNSEVVGMGGAAVGLAMGSSGTLTTPAAPAVKSTTDNDWWGWDYHVDYLTSLSRDYDNNGETNQDNGGPSFLTFGLAGRINDWGAAITATIQTAGLSDTLQAQTYRIKAAFAHYFESIDVAIGVGVQTVMFQLDNRGSSPALFQISGAGVEAGASWLPHNTNFRLGAAAEGPIDGGKVEKDCTDPACMAYILPDKVVSPYRLIAGGAYRFAATTWNHQVPTPFRDERSLILAADVVLAGSSPNGFGLEGFSEQVLQRSGRTAAVGVRGGAEYEWLPGRLRVRAGSYWEPGRFDGVSGRVHGTFSAEVRVGEVFIWGYRRGRLGVTGDFAARYRNVGLSIGLWH
jgi:hypothetical protein